MADPRRPLRHGYRALQLLDEQAPPTSPMPPRFEQVPAVLRIEIPDEPATPCGHPRTADNRWFVGGLELCRPCGRARAGR